MQVITIKQGKLSRINSSKIQEPSSRMNWQLRKDKFDDIRFQNINQSAYKCYLKMRSRMTKLIRNKLFNICYNHFYNILRLLDVFTIFYFHHKSNNERLLLINLVYISCVTSNTKVSQITLKLRQLADSSTNPSQPL